jgi:hypothetical protein
MVYDFIAVSTMNLQFTENPGKNSDSKELSGLRVNCCFETIMLNSVFEILINFPAEHPPFAKLRCYFRIL